MTDKAHKTIWIKWVRSAIGFSHRQKTVLRSLGLRRSNHVVERPDTPQVRGLVARIHHLVEVVPAGARTVAASMPEYTIVAPPQVWVVQDAAPKSGDGEAAGTATAAETAPAPIKSELAPKRLGAVPRPEKRTASEGKTKKAKAQRAPRKGDSEPKAKNQKSQKSEKSQRAKPDKLHGK